MISHDLPGPPKERDGRGKWLIIRAQSTNMIMCHQRKKVPLLTPYCIINTEREIPSGVNNQPSSWENDGWS